MTYESVLLAQADLGIVSRSTTERKKMSTKTLRKRIALTAVFALGAGLLSVAPANAVTITQTGSVTSVTDGTTANGVSVVYAAGTPITATVNVATATTMSAAGDYIGADVTVTGPSIASPAATNVAVASTVTPAAATATLTSASPSAGRLVGSWVSGSSTSAQPLGTVTFTPAQAGSYTITVTPIESKVAGTVSASSTLTAGTVAISVGSGSTLAATVGTSITALNAATGQANGLTAYRFQPAGFTKTANAVTTYFATVDAGTIDSVTNGANAGGTGGVEAMTNAWTNGTNNAAGAKLVATISAAGTWNAGGTQGVAPGYWDITLNSGSATTQTLTIKSLNATTGAITTIATATSTYGAAPALSTANSTSVLGTGTSAETTTGTDDTVVASKSAAQVANVKVTLLDQYNTALYGQTLSATISGSGLIAFNQSSRTQAGNARSASLVLTSSQNTAYLGISGDGTAGVGTITISVGTTVVGTETVKFYGAAATIEATQKLFVASKAGASLGTGVANPAGSTVAATPAVILLAKDANGVVVPGLTISAKSSDTAVMTETITINGDDGTGLGNGKGKGYYNVAVNSAANTSGKTATLTFRTLLSDGVTYVSSSPVTFTLGGSADTIALSLDKTSYTIGAAATAKLTVKDSSGNKAYDSDYANIMSSSAGLTSSLALAKTLFGATTQTVINGVASVDFNAPTVATDWTITGTSGTGLGTDIAKALKASATVTDLSTGTNALINSLIKKINDLAKLVAKIQKKLGIK